VAQTVTIGEQQVCLEWLRFSATPTPPVENPSDSTALPSPLETAEEAGYDTSKTAFHRDLSRLPFSSLTCQLPSPDSMCMLTT